jgi:hypothetical protein
VTRAAAGRHPSSNAFRRAAFTQSAEEDVHTKRVDVYWKRAAVAFDVTAETMMKYYSAAEKQQTTDDVLGTMGSELLRRCQRPRRRRRTSDVGNSVRYKAAKVNRA